MDAKPSSGTASNAGLDGPAGDAAFLLAAVFAAVAASCWLATAACGWLESCGEPDRLDSGVDARGVNEATFGSACSSGSGSAAMSAVALTKPPPPVAGMKLTEPPVAGTGSGAQAR